MYSVNGRTPASAGVLQEIPPHPLAFNAATHFPTFNNMITKAHNSAGDSLLRSVAMCFLLFSAASTLLTMYRAYIATHSVIVSLIPASRLPPAVQWLWLAGAAIGNVITAATLTQGWSRAKELLIVVTLLNTVIGILTSTASLGASLWVSSVSFVPVALIAMSGADTTTVDRDTPIGRKSFRHLAGRVLYGFAAFVMFVTLTSLFNGQTPAHATETDAGAGLFIAFGLSVMLIGGAVIGRTMVAIREAGLLLVSFASYLVAFCIWSYVALRLYFPRYRWHFFWDETLLWLIILAMAGFALLALSERRRTA